MCLRMTLNISPCGAHSMEWRQARHHDHGLCGSIRKMGALMALEKASTLTSWGHLEGFFGLYTAPERNDRGCPAHAGWERICDDEVFSSIVSCTCVQPEWPCNVFVALGGVASSGTISLHNRRTPICTCTSCSRYNGRSSRIKQYSTSLDSLGPLRSICATLIINGAAERIYALRSVHDKGSMDWVISLQKTPETITNIAFLPTKRSGAPAVLPPFIPGGSQTLSPPTDFGCLDLSVPQNADDLAEACKRWPAMCEN
jgi:hypothetical protein